MAQGGKAESMAHLRSAIAGIEAHSGPVPARAPLKLSLARSLDGALGGGLADDSLHEIAPAQAGDGAAALGFALALAARFVAASRPSKAAWLGRSLWAGGCRSWARLWPARLRSHARCASLAVDDGRGAQERRAGGRGRRNVEFGAPLWPRRFAPSAACGKGGPRAGPAYSWRRFWAGRRHFQRRRNAFRDRGGFQPTS